MRVELLYFDGCPSYHVLLPRLRELLVAASVSEEVALRRIESAEEAEAEHFLGSPTLRVDGQDVDPARSIEPTLGSSAASIEARAVSLACCPPSG